MAAVGHVAVLALDALAREAARLPLPVRALEHLDELACDPWPHGSRMEARPPVGELRGMTGAARLGRERGLERGEAPRRRALGCERLAPVADEELLDRVGAGGGDEAEHRQRSDRCRIRSCYPFLRTRSQNPRGSMILMGAAAAISRRSRSPVTSTSARLSIAEARTH